MQELREAGHPEQADRLATELIGRNVLAGRWTFQVVQEFDDGYGTAFRDHERRTFNRTVGRIWWCQGAHDHAGAPELR